eukprot:TRINITY_DN2138_c0_g1_i1.p1 TRINITY_DN2138_c0_g1~~TRINITY_DN2138_c0_g1_i1.p1  ORF type:complete len:208 (+),score=16.62 TRINITY_DN2138_c0_g1_i1:16-639(+)
MPHLLDLPEETRGIIFAYFSPVELCCLSLACKDLKRSADADALWRFFGSNEWKDKFKEESDAFRSVGFFKKQWIAWIRKETESMTLKKASRPIHKILIVGGERTGKSSLLSVWFHRVMPTTYVPTTDVQPVTVNGFQTKIQVWDTSGSTRSSMADQSTSGVIFVFDVSNADSLREAKDMFSICSKISHSSLIIRISCSSGYLLSFGW